MILGAGLMAVGHFMMAFEPLFLLALFTLILGNGAFKPNISTQVGGLYAQGVKWCPVSTLTGFDSIP